VHQQHDSNPAGPCNISALSLHAGMFMSFQLRQKYNVLYDAQRKTLFFSSAISIQHIMLSALTLTEMKC